MTPDPAYLPSERSAARSAPPVERQPAAAQRDPIGRARSTERRRREQRFRERRRDLLADIALACVLAITALVIAPGLGVVALVSIPVALALIGSVIAERALRRRRRARQRSPLR
ncbi:MAG: hypothetical protein ACR2HD_11675 [Solirubrobacteraceae bacterium]|nr:MAG: hypothetical protein DLM63_09600 [Solirubrobacterales bacterium]